MLFQEYRFKKRWPNVIASVFQNELHRWTRNNPSREELERYSFTVSSGKKGRRTKFFWDTPCGIALMYKDKEIACIGFYLGLRGVFIEQLQGMKGIDFKKVPLQWEKMLVEIVVECAGKLGFKSVSLLRADNNRWYYHRSGQEKAGSERELNNRLFMRYDVTARRRGFSPGEEYWKLKL